MKLNIRFQEQNENFRGFQESDEQMRFGFGQTQSITSGDYNVLINKPQINSVTIDGNVSLADLGLRAIYYDTKENWDFQRSLVSEEGALYIYSNYQTVYDDVGNPTFIAGIKIGDGNAYLIDIPFVSDAMTGALLTHISNTSVHVTAAEKEFWNNKVSAYIDHNPVGAETLILSKTSYEKNGEIITV